MYPAGTPGSEGGAGTDFRLPSSPKPPILDSCVQGGVGLLHYIDFCMCVCVNQTTSTFGKGAKKRRCEKWGCDFH